MAKDYTDEELQTAIGKILPTSLTRAYGGMGNRNTSGLFSQITDAAIGVFVTQQNSPYYVVALSRDILVQQVASLRAVLLDLDDTIRAADRFPKQVQSLTSLNNAKGALASLASAAASRVSAFSSLEDLAAYRRFEQNTSRFLSDHGGAIRSNGSVVQTPQEARERLAGLVATSLEQYEEVLRRTRLISLAISTYDSLRLPATLSKVVLENSQDVLAQDLALLEGMAAQDRPSALRQVMLDIMAVRSTTKGFVVLNAQGLFLYLEGLGTPFADATHPATAAKLVAEIGGPYAIYGDNNLDLLIDGSFLTTVAVPDGYSPSLDGALLEPYEVQAGVNDQLVIRATGVPDVTVTLTPGSGLSAVEVALDIQGALPLSHPVEVKAYGPQLYLQGDLVNLAVSGLDVTFSRVLGTWADLTNTQPQVGDWVLLLEAATPGNLGWYEVTDVTGLPTSFVAQKEDGSATSEAGVVASLNRGGRAVQLAFLEAERYPAIEGGWSITLPTFGDAIIQATLGTLGLIPDAEVAAQRVPAQNVASFINSQASVLGGTSPRVLASAEFQPSMYQGSARTEPSDASLVVCAKLRAVVSIPVPGVFVGLAADAPIEVGDVVAIREATTNSVLNFGIVTTITPGSSFTASMNTPTVPEANVVVEVGPDLRTNALPAVLKVGGTTPAPNDGTYGVLAIGGLQGTSPYFELAVDRPVLQPAGVGGASVPLNVSLGQDFLVLTSTSTLLDTSVAVVPPSPAEDTFWPTEAASAIGSTVYFQTPEDPSKVEVGDTLEFRPTGSSVADLPYSIERVLPDDRLLVLGVALSADWPTYDMTQNAPIPSARIRKVRRDTYATLQRGLEDWLSLPASNITRFFAELRRLLNPILSSSNPTAIQVQEVSGKVQSLLTHLAVLDTMLEAYTAPIVRQVDSLLDAYREQGAERAIDLLLECQFATFFGLAQDEVSYSGAMQKAMRDVATNDLPLPRTNRNQGAQLVESYEEPDWEYDTSDSEEQEVDAPTEQYQHDESAF